MMEKRGVVATEKEKEAHEKIKEAMKKPGHPTKKMADYLDKDVDKPKEDKKGDK